MATHSSILAWRIHGQRSLAGYSPWGHKELDTSDYHTWYLSSQNLTFLLLDSMTKDSNSYFSRLLPRIKENSPHKAFRTDSRTQLLCITNASSFIPSSWEMSNQGHHMVQFGSHDGDQMSWAQGHTWASPPHGFG